MIIDIKNLERHSYKDVCGVYFLFEGDEVVYIGQSINAYQRALNHSVGGRKPIGWKKPIKRKRFTSFAVFPVPIEKLRKVETDNINYYRPKYNKTYDLSEKLKRTHLIKKFNINKKCICHG